MTCRGQVNAVGICLKSLYREAPDLEQDRSTAQTVLRPRQFSFIGNATLRSFYASGTPTADRVWTHIESLQFIGWWRDAVSDAMTSSGHTGERAIHSSDFSAFTKRSHYPSLLRFLTQLTFCDHHLHFGDCLSGTSFSSRWSAMEYRRCQPPCARFIARYDPHR